MLFLDCAVSLGKDGNLRIDVYRKPTHIDQYFLFDSHHPLEHILEVIQMLQNQAKKVPSSTNRKQKELTHIEVVFQTCGYSKWTFVNSSERHNKEQPKAESEKRKNVVIPYMAGLLEKFRRIFRKHKI